MEKASFGVGNSDELDPYSPHRLLRRPTKYAEPLTSTPTNGGERRTPAGSHVVLLSDGRDGYRCGRATQGSRPLVVVARRDTRTTPARKLELSPLQSSRERSVITVASLAGVARPAARRFLALHCHLTIEGRCLTRGVRCRCVASHCSSRERGGGASRVTNEGHSRASADAAIVRPRLVVVGRRTPTRGRLRANLRPSLPRAHQTEAKYPVAAH
jgi:hypothetical protein